MPPPNPLEYSNPLALTTTEDVPEQVISAELHHQRTGDQLTLTYDAETESDVIQGSYSGLIESIPIESCTGSGD